MDRFRANGLGRHFLKSYERNQVAQRVGPVSWIQSDRFQRWLCAMNAHTYNIYVAWNWGACPSLLRQFAPCPHGAASVSEKEVRMPEHDVQWSRYGSRLVEDAGGA